MITTILTTLTSLLSVTGKLIDRTPNYPQKKKEIHNKMELKLIKLKRRFENEKDLDEFDHDALMRYRDNIEDLQLEINQYVATFVKELKS